MTARLSRFNCQRRHTAKYRASIKLKRRLYNQTARGKALARRTSKRFRKRLARAREYFRVHEGELGWVWNVLAKPL